jgi:putative ATPase
LMKDLGYGKEYRDPHQEGGFSSGVKYLPQEINEQRFYQPTESGYEAKIKRRLDSLWGRELPETPKKE